MSYLLEYDFKNKNSNKKKKMIKKYLEQFGLIVCEITISFISSNFT